MCGRYVAKAKPEDLAAEFGVQQQLFEKALEPDYNVAPTKAVYAVLDRVVEERPQRQLREVGWGLIPFWAKDPAIGSKMINARIETAAEKPAFRRAFGKRRCVLPADGYYEWYTPEDQRELKKPRKQPFFLHRSDGRSLAMAGLYELWRDPALPEEDPASWRWTAVILTTNSTDEFGHIHDRMPLLVPEGALDRWLTPGPVEEDLRDLLVPAMSGEAGVLTAYPVSTAVNSVWNNGPELIEPLPPEA